MRKIIGFLLAVSVVLFFAGCVDGQSVYAGEVNGIAYTVDAENRTITAGEHTYRYQLENDGNEKTITVFYPTGAAYKVWEDLGIATGSGFYDPDVYLDGEILVEIVQLAHPLKRESVKLEFDPLLVLGGIIVIILGIFEAASPEDAWRLANSWRFEYAEPSDLALTMTRFGGILSILVGILLALGII